MKAIVLVTWAHEERPYGSAMKSNGERVHIGAKAITEMQALVGPMVGCYFEVNLEPNAKEDRKYESPLVITLVHSVVDGFEVPKAPVQELSGPELLIRDIQRTISSNLRKSPNDLAFELMTDGKLVCGTPEFAATHTGMIAADEKETTIQARKLLMAVLKDKNVRDLIMDEVSRLANNDNGNGHAVTPASGAPTAETELDIQPASAETAVAA